MKTKYLLLAGLTATITFIVLFVLAYPARHAAKQRPKPPSPEEKRARYSHLVSHRIPTPKPGFYPCFIFRDIDIVNGIATVEWKSSGTVLMDGNAPKYVLSAAHCFSEDGTYTVGILATNLGKTLWDIQSVAFYPTGSDTALATIGASTLLKGLPVADNALHYDVPSQFAKQPKMYARSLITGEAFEVIGSVQLNGTNGESFFIIDYSCVRAESGSAFMEIKTPSDEIGTGNLFVVKQFIMIDNNTQRMLGIEPREGTFTLASSTSVGWPKK